MVNNVVDLLPLPPGETMEAMIPINYAMASVEQVGKGEVHKEQSSICCVVEKMEDQINTAKHMVAVNRTRCILTDVINQQRSYCWFFGAFSDRMLELGVMERDFVMICCPTVVRTKLKPRQVLPPNMSTWTIHCQEKDPQPSVTFLRQEDQEPVKEMNTGGDNDQQVVIAVPDEELMNESQLAVVVNKSPNKRLSPQPARVALQRRPPPTKPVQVPMMRPPYTNLANCKVHKKRYNVFAVVSEIREPPQKRKSKIVTKLSIQDESLFSSGDLRENYKFDILADSMEQVPVLVVGAVLRIHHMVVEVFNGIPDGRVYSGHCVTVVEGGVGQSIKPSSTKKEDLNWGQEDDWRVEELRNWSKNNNVDDLMVRTIEEIVNECTTSLSCRVVTITRDEEWLVMRVEDGTCSQVVSMEYRGQDTMTQEEAGNNKHFIDVWVRSLFLVDSIRRQSITAKDWVRMHRVKCIKEEAGQDLPAVFRFIVEDGDVDKLGEEDAEVNCIIERLEDKVGDEPMDSQADSYVDRILTAVNREGTFSFPDLGPENNEANQTSSHQVLKDKEVFEDKDSNSRVGNTGELGQDSDEGNSACVSPVDAETPTTTTVIENPHLASPLHISLTDAGEAALPDIVLPSPDSEISFPLLEKSLSVTPSGVITSPTPPSLPLGQQRSSPPTVNMPDSMSSTMSIFETEESPLRYPGATGSCSSPATSQFFTPPGSPGQALGSQETSVDDDDDDDDDLDITRISVGEKTCDDEELSSNNTTIQKSRTTDRTPEMLNDFRKYLRVVCWNTVGMCRVDCTSISSMKTGKYRLMGWISQVEEEDGKLLLLRGICQECGNLDKVEMFEERGPDIFCCKRGRVTLRAKKILYVVMYVTDKECSLDEQVKLVVKDKDAEEFLRCSTKQFLVEKDARDIVENKVRNLKGAFGDFGVEKNYNGDLSVVHTAIRES